MTILEKERQTTAHHSSVSIMDSESESDGTIKRNQRHERRKIYNDDDRRDSDNKSGREEKANRYQMKKIMSDETVSAYFHHGFDVNPFHTIIVVTNLYGTGR